MRRLLSALGLILILVSACSGGAKQHDLDGSVLIFQATNMSVAGTTCQGDGNLFDLIAGSPVRITPSGKDAIWSELTAGSITEEGNCRLKFKAQIPEADSYMIEVGGRMAVTRARASIDRPNGWWVTLDWDAMSVVPNP
jgi:hypothetical protein